VANVELRSVESEFRQWPLDMFSADLRGDRYPGGKVGGAISKSPPVHLLSGVVCKPRIYVRGLIPPFAHLLHNTAQVYRKPRLNHLGGLPGD
jgi:hypothetical protein